MVAFAHVEDAAIGRDRLDDGRNHRVRIGVALAMRVGGQIVRHQVVAHLEVLRDGLAVIARHSRRRKSRMPGFQRVNAGRDARERELTGVTRPGFLGRGGRRSQAHIRLGQGLRLRIAEATGDCGCRGGRHQPVLLFSSTYHGSRLDVF